MLKKSPPPLHFIITGGTIDSHFDGSKDTAIPNKNSIIPRYIQSLKLYNKTKFSEVCMKDSRDILKSDLKKVLNKIEKSTYKHFIVTHGTYTVPDSARYIKANLKRTNAVIILTASMLPMLDFTMSDGGFNLGYAVAKAQDLKPGVYICINGKVFSSDEIIKVVSQGMFTSILGEEQR